MLTSEFKDILGSVFRDGERIGYQACIGDVATSLAEKISAMDEQTSSSMFEAIAETLHELNDASIYKVFDDEKVLEAIVDFSD